MEYTRDKSLIYNKRYKIKNKMKYLERYDEVFYGQPVEFAVHRLKYPDLSLYIISTQIDSKVVPYSSAVVLVDML